VANEGRHGEPPHVKCSRPIRRRIAGMVLLVTMAVSVASPALADPYDQDSAGHPLRIAAYIVYPIGKLIDLLIMRPGHWLISQEPFKGAVGHHE
jgi:hypothetical protein